MLPGGVGPVVTVEEMLVELCAEVQMRGSIDQLSPAFRDDYLWRLSTLYDALPADHEDRRWCLLTAAIVSGEVAPEVIAEVLEPLL